MLWPVRRAHSAGSTPKCSQNEIPACRRSQGRLARPEAVPCACQDVLPCPRPGGAVRGSVHVVAGLVPEQPPGRRHAEPFDVRTEDAHELRRDKHRSGRGSRTALERVHLVHRTVARPVLSCGDDAARQVEHPPSGLGEVTLFEPEADDLRGPHGRAVHAAEERLKVRTASALLGNRREEPGDLGRMGDGSRVHLSGHYFYVLADGGAVNFLHGAAVGSYIHLVQAEILAATAALSHDQFGPEYMKWRHSSVTSSPGAGSTTSRCDSVPPSTQHIRTGADAYLSRYPHEYDGLTPLFTVLLGDDDPTSRETFPAHVTCSIILLDIDVHAIDETPSKGEPAHQHVVFRWIFRLCSGARIHLAVRGSGRLRMAPFRPGRLAHDPSRTRPSSLISALIRPQGGLSWPPPQPHSRKHRAVGT